MATYLVKTLKNPRYSGKLVGGVRVFGGKALLSQEALDEAGLGWTLKQALAALYDTEKHNPGTYEITPAGMSMTARIEKILSEAVIEDDRPEGVRGSRQKLDKIQE